MICGVLETELRVAFLVSKIPNLYFKVLEKSERKSQR
jgi:hypothetical protein